MKMITIANCSTIQEAQMIKIRLEVNGIEAFIPDETMAQMEPPLMFATPSGVRVQVAEEDAEEARRILKQP